MNRLLLLLTLLFSLAAASPARAQDYTVGARQCGQNLHMADKLIVRATCIERDVARYLASCRTCQNVAFVGIMVGFTGVAQNINSGDNKDYHVYQFVGQTSASYLLYTTNTSRGGLLRWWGLLWMTNATFQAVVNRASGLCPRDRICWTDREPSTYDLHGFAMPKLWSGNRRETQFGLGLLLTALGLGVDVVDHFYTKQGRSFSDRVTVAVAPDRFLVTVAL